MSSTNAFILEISTKVSQASRCSLWYCDVCSGYKHTVNSTLKCAHRWFCTFFITVSLSVCVSTLITVQWYNATVFYTSATKAMETFQAKHLA